MKDVEKSGVVDRILAFAKFKANQALQKKGGTKKIKLTGIAKLDDANHAGSAKSKDCTLILTEGDSAKSLAMSGLSVVGRDYYGVFPLKGKPLNVREASHKQVRIYIFVFLMRHIAIPDTSTISLNLTPSLSIDNGKCRDQKHSRYNGIEVRH